MTDPQVITLAVTLGVGIATVFLVLILRDVQVKCRTRKNGYVVHDFGQAKDTCECGLLKYRDITRPRQPRV